MKKKQKEKEEKENKITLKMLWSHPFYNSLIKLGIWFIFFTVLYLILILSKPPKKLIDESNEKEEEKTEIKLSYIDMKKNFLNSELSINYNIGNYVITGLINNNILTGTLEDEEKVVKIKYDGENIYQVKKEEEIVNNELIKDINISYLLPSKIIEIIDNPKVISIKSVDELTYSYNVDGSAISVYLNENRIEKIIILDNDITYDLEYKEVINEK